MATVILTTDSEAWLNNTHLLLSLFHEFYESAGRHLEDCRILEYGGGPGNIYPLISAARFASSIVFAEHAEQNREVTELWRAKSKKGPDLSHLFNHVVGTLEGTMPSNDEARDREEKLRSLISDIVPCDITESEAVGDNVARPFDVVSTHFCLSCGCRSVKEYRLGLKKLARLLRPGGTIVMTEALRGSYYVMGGEKISQLCLHSSEMVHSSLVEAGFTCQPMKSVVPFRTEMTDSTEYVFCTGILA